MNIINLEAAPPSPARMRVPLINPAPDPGRHTLGVCRVQDVRCHLYTPPRPQATRICTWSSAGHSPPILVDPECGLSMCVCICVCTGLGESPSTVGECGHRSQITGSNDQLSNSSNIDHPLEHLLFVKVISLKMTLKIFLCFCLCSSFVS